MRITHASRYTGFEGRCGYCNTVIKSHDNCYLAGTGLDENGNSFITHEDFEDGVIFCAGTDCLDNFLNGQEVAG